MTPTDVTRDHAEVRETINDLPMRIGAGQFMVPTEGRLRFIRQLGIKDVLLNFYQYDLDYPQLPDDRSTAPLQGDREWGYDELVTLRERIEQFDLRLNAIENMPTSFYDKIMLGKEGRKQQIKHVQNTLRNMARAGIPMFGYHWMPSGVWRTSMERDRGGAEVTAFDLDEADPGPTHDRVYSEEEMWENYEWFLERILPVVEETGLRMCLHPSDPPVETLGGVGQIARNFENYRRAMQLVPSDNHGLEFCLGCWSEMEEDLEEVIRYFGERDKIFYIHFRDVIGVVPSFRETFIDQGNYDEYEILKLLREVGFSGLIISDHVPKMEGDTEWGHRGRAYALGYLKGMMNAIEHEEETG